MATTGKIICLLAAFIVAEAHKCPYTHKDQHMHKRAKVIKSNVGPPQQQRMFDIPVEQGTGPSFAGPSVGGPSIAGPSTGFMNYGDFDSSSSSEVSDFDVDLDTDTNDADNVGSFVFGGNGNQISGNMRPMFGGNGRQRFRSGMDGGDYDKLKARTTGSSGRGVGIAFGVLGLLTLVVAAAFFTIRRYRNNMPLLLSE